MSILRSVRTKLIIRRLSLDMSQADLGAVLGVTRRAISFMEAPEAGDRMRVNALGRWAEALGARLIVDVDYVSAEEAAGRRAFEAHAGETAWRWEAFSDKDRQHWINVAKAVNRA